jgi:hypothetical protein
MSTTDMQIEVLQQIADGMRDQSATEAIDGLRETIDKAARRIEDGLLQIAKALRERNP